MKPKRIKAMEVFVAADGIPWKLRIPGGEPAYLLRQSDVRAFAEQMKTKMDEGWDQGRRISDYEERRLAAVLFALRYAGITPGRARKGGGK